MTIVRGSVKVRQGSFMRTYWLGILLLTGGCLASDGDREDSSGSGAEAAQTPIEMTGVWLGDDGARLVINSESWGVAEIADYDNLARIAYLRTKPEGQLQFARVHWTAPADNTVWLCVDTQGHERLGLAQSEPALVDRGYPHLTGCLGGPWTRYRNPIDLTGAWTHQGSEPMTITARYWGRRVLHAYLNDNNRAVISNGPYDYDKLTWIDPENGVFYLCVEREHLAEAEEALYSMSEADPTDLENGCQGESWKRYDQTIEVAGLWRDSRGLDLRVSALGWGPLSVVEYDNTKRRAVLERDGLFQVMEWTQPVKEAFFSCVTDQDLESLSAAQESSLEADRSDPGTGGCRDEPWRSLRRPIAVAGRWLDPFGDLIIIDAETWHQARISSYDNLGGLAITVNNQDADRLPGSFSKRAYTPVINDTFYHCEAASGLASFQDAEAAEAIIARAAPEEGGCLSEEAPWETFRRVVDLMGEWRVSRASGEGTTEGWNFEHRALLRFGERYFYDSWSNSERWLVLQRPDQAGGSPGNFDRYRWSKRLDGSTLLCAEVANSSLAEAQESPVEANPRDLVNGCPGGDWLRMEPR